MNVIQNRLSPTCTAIVKKASPRHSGETPTVIDPLSVAHEYVHHPVAKVGINPTFGVALADTVQLSGHLDRSS
jgi:hypothetical protein